MLANSTLWCAHIIMVPKLVCFFFCSLILTYTEGVEMLRANGVEMGDEDDLR